MRLADVAAVIHPILYRRWRLTGLAYEKRECEYTVPNKTLVNYVICFSNIIPGLLSGGQNER